MNESLKTDFDAALGEYLRRIEAGETVSCDELFARYPEHAEELCEFLKNEGWLRGLPEFASPQSPQEQWVGRQLGRYMVVEILGSGGMGIVCRADDHLLQRQVAIKLLASGSLASKEEVQRIRSEAAAVARLDHPHILPIFEVGTENGHPFLVMPLLPKDDLQRRLQQGPLEPDAAAQLLYELATAVAHAHDRGVIHRDLKPANVLFANDGRAMLADFGLAKAPRCDSLITASGQLLGTPQYMSPEQASGHGATGPSTDIYGLGAILYAMLTGVPPHQGASLAEIIRHVLEDEVAPPRNLRATVPRELQAICMACLHREPSQRYASAQALVDDLRRFRLGEPTWASRSGPWTALARPIRRDAHRLSFQYWGPTLTGFGLIVLIAHLLMAWLRYIGLPIVVAYFVPRFLMFGSMILLLARVRAGRIGPQSAVERPVWSIWSGYLLALLMANILLWQWSLPMAAIFPISAVLSGFGFIATGGQAWGGCYLIGAGFLGLAPLLVFMPFPEIGLGFAWLLSLAILGKRYWKPWSN